MNRLRRRLSTTLTLFSAILIPALALLYPRTLHTGDYINYLAKSGNLYTFGTHPHGITLSVTFGYSQTYGQFQADSSWASPIPEPTPGWSKTFLPYGQTFMLKLKTSDEPVVHAEGFKDGVYYDEQVSMSYGVPPPPAHSKFGFGWEYENLPWTPAPPVPYKVFRITVPLWFLMVLCTLLPAVWLKRRLRNRHRAKLHLCQSCGYDLRATPNLCPECGAIPQERKVISIRA